MLSTSLFFILLTNPSGHIKWWITRLFISTQGLKSGLVPILYCKKIGNDFRLTEMRLNNSFSWRLSCRETAEELNLSPKQLFALSSDNDSL